MDRRESVTYSGTMVNNEPVIEDMQLPQSGEAEYKCDRCGEFIYASSRSIVLKCPYCNNYFLADGDDDTDDEDMDEDNCGDEEMPGWENYDFDYPMNLKFPRTVISQGLDWIDDCEKDNVFGLNPECFAGKNQYDAALRICRICEGWYYYEEDEDRKADIELYTGIYEAKKGSPLWYYDTTARK